MLYDGVIVFTLLIVGCSVAFVASGNHAKHPRY